MEQVSGGPVGITIKRTGGISFGNDRDHFLFLRDRRKGRRSKETKPLRLRF